MKTYFYRQFPFRQKWAWFTSPQDEAGVDLLNVFSYDDVSAPGFKKKLGWTSVINLQQDLGVIKSKFRQKFILEQLEKGERKGIVVKQDNNFTGFYPLYKNFRALKKIARDRYAVLKREGILFSAYHEGEMLAGGIFIGDGASLRAWVLASKRLDNVSGPERELVGQANRLIIWEAIKYAKEHGYQLFDLGGINPDSGDRSEQGLAEFKEAFGGERVQTFYYTKSYSPLLNFWLKLRRLWR